MAGRRESATFDTKSEAHRWAEETEHLLLAGQPLPGELPGKDKPLEEAINLYLAHLEKSQRKEATKRMYRECAERILRAFPRRTLRGMETKDISRYKQDRLQQVGPASVRHDFVFLRGLYRHARLDWGIDIKSPTEDISMPAPPRHREPLLSLQEIERLLDWCCASDQEKLYIYVLVMLHTAMRPSEAASLTWDRVRLTEGIILLKETKTGKPRRVPLTVSARKTLAQMPSDKDGLVFLPRPIKPGEVTGRYFRRSFSTACRNAGISGITLYSLRHIAASYLIMNGVDIRTVADIMGHSDISQTMRYTHLLDGHKLAAISALDKIGR